jgi:hypothetical protein
VIPIENNKSIEEFGQLPDAIELRRRAELFAEIDSHFSETATMTLNYNGKNSDRYFWEDGGGQECNIIFRADSAHDDAVLLYTYDHESAFNVYGSPEEQKLFNTIPHDFEHLLEEDNLKWEWDDSENKVVYATSALWREHGSDGWRLDPGYLAQVIEEGENGGFTYCLQMLLKEPTLENYRDYYLEMETPEEDLAFLPEILAKHNY